MISAIEEVQNTWTKGKCYGFVDELVDEEELRKAEVGPRYYIHHHREGRTCKKDEFKNCVMDPLVASTRCLADILQADNVEFIKASTFNKVKSTPNALRIRLNKKAKAKIVVGSELKVPTAHVLTPATCSRYAAACEGCRKTVYRTRYLYCKNCPVVVHNKRKCLELLKIRCPALELGILGWGEGKAEPRKMLKQVYDLYDVMLSEPLNNNKCGGCGCILDINLGHPCPPSSQPDPREPKKNLKGRFKDLRQGILKILHKDKEEKDTPLELHLAKKYYTCHLTKKHYCEKCHWNDTWYIPPAMIHLNDYSRQPVCRAAYLKLRILWDTAVVAIPEEWFFDTETGKRFYLIRRKLKEIMRYISVCTVAQSMRKLLDDLHAPHLLECCSLLRMVDLCHVVEGNLYDKLKDIEAAFEAHIKQCSLCLSINLRCCGCGNGDPLFYYADDVGICRKCDRPFHWKCRFDHSCT